MLYKKFCEIIEVKLQPVQAGERKKNLCVIFNYVYWKIEENSNFREFDASTTNGGFPINAGLTVH